MRDGKFMDGCMSYCLFLPFAFCLPPLWSTCGSKPLLLCFCHCDTIWCKACVLYMYFSFFLLGSTICTSIGWLSQYYHFSKLYLRRTWRLSYIFISNLKIFCPFCVVTQSSCSALMWPVLISHRWISRRTETTNVTWQRLNMASSKRH